MKINYKADLVDKETIGVLQASIKKLNPRAKIILTSHSKVNLSEVINTGLFNYEEAEQSAGWIEELKKDHHTPETEEYGISSFVFRDKKPFHPDRFLNYIEKDFPSTIIRSKGLFWMASRPAQAMTWSQADGSVKADSAGVWWSSMPYSVRTTFTDFIYNQTIIEEGWDEFFGDRKNELVFIGQDLDQETIMQDLKKCLCTEEEINKIKWEDGDKDTWPVQRAIPPHKQEFYENEIE